MIDRTAILKDGKIYKGKKYDRHDKIILSKPEDFFTNSNSVQGFITDKGKFLDRKEAAVHALHNRQISEVTNCLISEDLF